MYQKILTVKELLGLNNVLPPERIPPGEKSFQTVAKNIDIDDARKGTLRAGYADPVYRGRGLHSLFDYHGTSLFVEGSDLKILNPDYSADIVQAGVGYARMNYVGVQDRIYYTNNSVIAYYDITSKQSVQFVEPNQTYKSIMKPGHLIEWFQGRLYVARDGELWASDPMAPHQTDTRRGFKQMGGYLSMIKGVEDGLYVSNGDKTYFLSGEFTEMVRKTVDEHPCILGTDLRVDAEFVGLKNLSGWVITWLTRTGFAIGAKGGDVIKVTPYYRPELEFSGTAILRKIVKSENQQFYQYLVGQKINSDVMITSSAFEATGSLAASLSIA